MKPTTSEILNSLSTLRRVEPNPYLLTRITARLQALHTAYATRWQVRLAITGTIALIVVNLLLIHQLTRSESSTPTVLMNNYQLY